MHPPLHPRHAAAPRQPRGARFLVPLLLASAGFLPVPAAARDTAPPPSAVLEDLNTGFRALYRQRTQEVLASLPLVLVVQNHTITAVRGNQRRLYPVPLQRYNDARSVLHAALGFHGLMSSLAHAGSNTSTNPDLDLNPSPGVDPASNTGSLPGAAADADWARVDALLRDIRRARQAVGGTALSREERSHARQALDMLADACRQALAARSVTPAWVADTLRRAEPTLMALTDSVGQAHARAMAAVLRQVRAEASETEWSKVVAVVTGPMTPRRNNLETAAVASVIGREHLGTRIFYSENIFAVDGALSYLQTLVGDRELSLAVFGQPHRMWEDLFAPVSRRLVEGDFHTELAR